MICNKCKKEITDGVKFCKFCGSPVSTTESVSQPSLDEHTDAPDGKPKKKKMKKRKKIVLSIIITLLSVSIIGTILAFLFLPVNKFYVSQEVVIDNNYNYDDSVDVYKDVYKYDEYGLLIEHTRDGKIVKKYELDKNGRIDKIVNTDEDGNSHTTKLDYEKTDTGYIGSCKNDNAGIEVEVTYNNKNQIIKIFEKDGSEATTISRRYNFLGHIAYEETVTSSPDNDEFKIASTYDYKGNILLYEEYSNGNLDCSSKYKNGVQTSNYICFGNRYSTGDETAESSYANYSYDKKGNFIGSQTFDKNDNLLYETVQDLSKEGIWLICEKADGSVSYIDCKLDKKGNIIKEEYLDENKEILFSYEYTYDKKGNLIKTEYLVENNEVFSTFRYTYDKHGNMLTSTSYNLYGNVTEETTSTYKRKPIFNW